MSPNDDETGRRLSRVLLLIVVVVKHYTHQKRIKQNKEKKLIRQVTLKQI